MTSESKILTVSYGTFSCTLEGFDDPFNTMKAIAEYFRDLTAEDRYFGAVPPQPDAAMLHRVADREVSRLVGSKSRDAGLVLRPGDLAPAEGRVTGRPRTMRAPADDPAPPPVVEPSLQDSMPSGVVAKLARIREAVSQPLDEARPEDVLNAFREEIEATEPALDNLAVEAEAEVAVETSPSADDAASRIGALLQDPDAEARMAEANIFADLAASEPAPQPVEDGALVTAEASDADEAPFVAVDDFQPEMMAEDGSIFLDAGVAAYEDDALPALETLTAAVEAEAVSVAEPVEPAEVLSGTEALLADASETLPDLSEAPLPEDEAETEAPLPPGRFTGKTRRVSSRVVRIHPDDTETRSGSKATRMVAADEAEEVARLIQRAEDVMAEEENRHRLESLAHLKAAVTATEADRDAGVEMKSDDSAKADAYRDDLAQVVQPDPEPAPTDVRPRRKTVSVRPQEPRPGTIRPGMISPPPLVLVSEQRVDRIAAASEAPPAPQPAPPPAPAQAPAQMPAAAFAPAAFAPATRVPVQLPSGPSQPGIDGQPLVALRTGRLTGAIGIGAAAASPAMPSDRLVLNRATPAPAVEAEDEDGLDEQLTDEVEAGLARFADSVGVKSMAEMLEASAAYAICVEGRGQFTRPQLMRRLMASAGGKPVSREEALRSFGTLLRTGRIEKVGRGNYVLADQSPYLAEARRFD